MRGALLGVSGWTGVCELFTGVTGTEVGTTGACVTGARLRRGYREAMLLLLLLVVVVVEVVVGRPG